MAIREQPHRFVRVSERVIQVCAAATAFVFLVTGLVYLYLGRLTVTHQDYWQMYDFYFSHGWLESALIKYYNHSLFFPTLLRLADLRFFHGDQLPLFLTGLALLFITTLLLLIPIWCDKTVSLTAKIISTVVVIVGNFWMGRASITASGGFNCENSLAMAAAAGAFLFVRKMSLSGAWPLQPMPVVLLAGVVASFSFGGGLAIWPTLLCLGWFLRLPRRYIGVFIAAGLAVGIVFALLPETFRGAPSVRSIGFDLVFLCRLIGNPVLDAASAWWVREPFVYITMHPGLATFTGALGLMLLAAAVIPQIVRRDIQERGLEFAGLALVLFSVLVLVLITVGRSSGKSISTAALPRYFFWSILFWAGLYLIGVARADTRPALRWIVSAAVIALPIMIFPAHYKNALFQRRLRIVAESGATSLVNGVQLDERQVKALFFGDIPTHLLYRVAEEMRERRLDMFAEGLQDWIGLEETHLFGGRHKPEGLRGQCKLDALVQCDNGAPAARITGNVRESGHRVPTKLVIVDPAGVVRGIGRSSDMYSPNRFVNRTFYLRKTAGTKVVGYITDFNPKQEYVVRSADNGTLSDERLPVEIPLTGRKP